MSRTRPVKNQFAYHEKIKDHGVMDSTSLAWDTTSLPIDVTESTAHKITLADDLNIHFSEIPAEDNIPDNSFITLTLLVQQDSVGGHNLNFITDLNWPYGDPINIEFSSNTLSMVSFFSYDAGKTWRSRVVNSAPVGTVITFAGATSPHGYLECDGSEISRIQYANLFNTIGCIYGEGDGSTTFNLPDLRGEFVRGWDNGRGVDDGREFGTNQGDLYKSHSHRIYYYETGDGGGDWTWAFDSSTSNQGIRYQYTTTSGGSETRPRNIAMMYCIKY